MRAAVALAVSVLVACSVPDIDLDGRPCPCVDGWVCDTATDRCVRVGGTDAGSTDSGSDDGGSETTDAGDGDAGPGGTDAGGVDGGGTPGCFYDDFEDNRLDGWVTSMGSWTASGGEAMQTDDSASRAYMYATATEGTTDFRARVRMRMISATSGDAMEIDFRINTAEDGEQYFCNWEPVNGQMVLMHSDAMLNARSINDFSVDVSAIPGYDPRAPVTMVLEVRGDSFRCWVEEVPGTEILASDSRYRAGAVGLKTYRMHAAFDWFEVCPL